MTEIKVEKQYDSWQDTLTHIQNVRAKIRRVILDLMERSARHDACKLEAPEKEYYDLYTQDLRTLEYNSPAYKETLKKMQPGIDHHYSVSDHHPEHFIDGINGMNLVNMVEMLCDWKAAGERHVEKPTDIYKSIEINAERFGMDEQLKQILLNTASYLWGEE